MNEEIDVSYDVRLHDFYIENKQKRMNHASFKFKTNQ